MHLLTLGDLLETLCVSHDCDEELVDHRRWALRSCRAREVVKERKDLTDPAAVSEVLLWKTRYYTL